VAIFPTRNDMLSTVILWENARKSFQENCKNAPLETYLIGMKENPYPQGRWTPKADPILSTAKSQRVPLFAQPASTLLNAPLRELFWCLPESRLLEEARQRVEAVVVAALARQPAPELKLQREFAWL